MDRRNFMKGTLAAGSVAGLAVLPLKWAMEEDKVGKKKEYYELRTYTLADAKQKQGLLNYVERALKPALQRQKLKPLMLFEELEAKAVPRIFLLLTYPSLEQVGLTGRALQKDQDYRKAAAPYLNAPPSAPAYARIESSLLEAFSDMPQMDMPDASKKLFELRCYESATEFKGKKKVEMFNEGGEIAIFKRTGLEPVFFGETLIGPLRPNLTYMICFEDMPAHDAAWKAFGNDAEWKRINGLEEYKDTVSKITRTFLKKIG